jgi:hypothetical protein
MGNNFVVLPDDATNTGKRVRTNDRIVSATTVHEHYWIAQDPTNDVQARVVSAAPSANAAGMVVWPAINTVTVSNAISGNVAISGAVSGIFSISGTVDTELLAPAAVADNTANPTITQIQVYPMNWDVAVSSWYRLKGDAIGGILTQGSRADGDFFDTGPPSGFPLAMPAIGVSEILQEWVLLRLDEFKALKVALYDSVGTVLPGNTTNGLDVDVTRVIPGTSATNLGKAEDAGHTTGDTGVFVLGVRNTTNATRTNADADYAPMSTDLWDAPISGTRRQTTTLTAINTTYDDNPTTANSALVDCSMFRRGCFCATVTETAAATDITFTLQFSNDSGTTWFDYRVGPWVKYRFDDATIAAHTSGELKICEPFECVAPSVRMAVVAVGTDATNKFTVANASFELVN